MVGKMNASELKDFLKKYFSKDPSDVPSLFIWGPPGVGKSSVVKQAAAEAFGVSDKRFFVDIRLTLADPTDFKGLPFREGTVTIWLPPKQLPNSDDAPRGVLFLDELPSAPPAVQVTAHRLVLEKEIEEYKMPDGWFVIAAGNRRMDRAVTYELHAPLANRFVHIELQPDLEAWKTWALKNGINPNIISFLNFRPSLLLDMKTAEKSMAFCTPRSWEHLSKMMSFLDGEIFEISKGCIGEGAAAEFHGFLQLYSKLPDPVKALRKKIIPKEPSELYALCGAITELYTKNPYLAESILSYSYRLPKEFAVMLVRDCLKADPYISSVKEWKWWAKRFEAYVL